MSITIRKKHQREKKKIVSDGVDLVATHPLADKIKKAEFMARMEGGNYSPVNRVNSVRSDLRTISSQIYTAMKTNYSDLGGVCTTEKELDQHLEWLFDQVKFYADETKDLLRKQRKELLIETARRLRDEQKSENA